MFSKVPETDMSAEPTILKQTPPSPTFVEDRFPRGAEILIEGLVHEGVDSIFGYPGGAVLHIYDELWRWAARPPPSRGRSAERGGGQACSDRATGAAGRG